MELGVPEIYIAHELQVLTLGAAFSKGVPPGIKTYELIVRKENENERFEKQNAYHIPF